jgi:hypothetical protein
MKTASGAVLPALAGTAFGGGIYVGRFFVGAEAYALIVAPKAEGELEISTWHGSSKNKVAGALDVYDGAANTAAMAEAGSQLASWARDLRLGGCDGWYLPSRGEALLAFAAGLEGDEAFEQDWYWTSTQFAADSGYAWYQYFDYGTQTTWPRGGKFKARAVRRVKIT